MLNPFPGFLILTFFAPFILRTALGGYVLVLSHGHLRKHFTEYLPAFEARFAASGSIVLISLGVMELVVGIALILGLYTQIASLIVGSLSILAMFSKNSKSLFGAHKSTSLFMFIIAFSLLMTGAGAFAFDIPL